MIRAVLLPLALAACASVPEPAPQPVEEVRPVVAQDKLQGRWTIVAVNGKASPGLWLELGGEGIGAITQTGNAVYVATPLPETEAMLGCNWWRPNGWSRNGDKLSFGLEMSTMTERGCDPEVIALEELTYSILRKTLTMEMTPPDRMRLINEVGSVDLVRAGKAP